MKKKLSLFLSVLIFAVVLTVLFAVQISADTYGYYTYTVSNGQVTITDVNTLISGNVTIPSALGGYPVTTIGDGAFYLCQRMTSVNIPDSVTTIGVQAFGACTNLTNIYIPDNVTTISDLAFWSCLGFTSIEIPSGVTTIGDGVFDGCENISKVTVDTNNVNYSSFNGILFNKDKTVLIYYPTGIGKKTYVIPSGVTSIGNYAFSFCSDLTSISIPNSVTSIGNYSFYFCSALTSVEIPDNVTSIGDCAFFGCSSLKKITFNGTPTTIYDSSSTIPSGATIYCYADNITVQKYGEKYGRNVIIMPCKNGCTYEDIVDDAYLISSGSCSEKAVYYKSCRACKNASDTLTFQGDYVHSYTLQNISDAYLKSSATCTEKAVYYYCCAGCDQKGNTTYSYGSALGHTGGSATCTAKAVCTRCHNEYGEKLRHNFNKEVATDTYFASAASCTAKAKYYKSCACGEKATATFNYGSTLPHSYTLQTVSNTYKKSNATCIAKAVYYYCCITCRAKGTNTYEYGSFATHTYSSTSDTSCNVCGDERILVTITYNANGGSSAPSSQTVEKGKSVTVSNSTPTRSGYKFQGWATNVVGEVKFSSGSSFTPTEDVTLYAMWLKSCSTCGGIGKETKYRDCSKCQGSGRRYFSETCYVCNGNGKTYTTGDCYISACYSGRLIDINTGTYLGTCGVCKGTGEVQVSHTCSTCEGAKIISGFITCDSCNGNKYSGTYTVTCSGCDGNCWSKISPAEVAPQPILESQSETQIVLVAVEGCEYSRDGKTWQASPVFNNLLAGTHTFYQRYAATSTTIAGQKSEGLVVKGLYVLGDFNSDEKLDMKDVVYFMNWINFSWTGKYPMVYEGDKDFNKDGNVDMKDVVYFMNWVNFSWTGNYDINW